MHRTYILADTEYRYPYKPDIRADTEYRYPYKPDIRADTEYRYPYKPDIQPRGLFLNRDLKHSDTVKATGNIFMGVSVTMFLVKIFVRRENKPDILLSSKIRHRQYRYRYLSGASLGTYLL